MLSRRVVWIVLIPVLAAAVAVIWALQPFVRSGVAPTATPMPILQDDEVMAALEKAVAGTPVDAVMVLRDGRVVASYGDNALISNVASVRKSIIATLFGIAVDKGFVDLDATLGDLGVDEAKTPLTAAEKTATVRDLLMARSGVYLPSGAETEEMRNMRPARGAHAPGENFYYNNWDFNVLGEIFEQSTELSIGEALDQWIGSEIGLEDFLPEHVTYAKDGDSDYETWRIYLSNRDLARLGQLVKNGGLWEGKQIVPSAWITDMLTAHSETPQGYGYGYLWWIDDADRMVLAQGWGGQYLMLAQDRDIVVAIKNNTGRSPLGFVMYRYFDEEVSTELANRVWETAVGPP
ncbi:serine hydrolase domain-containing protein [Tabrizicola sp.]|uniref:serine hydrolase domain-containing protein n=1 Tax=Tabrizicola sp. TaxID=2005166 RepID=UPI003F3666B9